MTNQQIMEKSKKVEPDYDVEFNKFMAAWQVFAGDLGLVNAQDRLTPQDPFLPPSDAIDVHGEHAYHLTVMAGNRQQILEKLSKIKIIALSCMDWRFASSYYDYVQSQHDYQPDEVLFVGVGGGAVQLPQDRQIALAQILSFVSAHSPELETAFLSGHTHRCGAVAHWLHAGPGELPKELGPQKGGTTEIEKMGDMVSQSATALAESLDPKVAVNFQLLSLDHIDESAKKTAITISDL